VDRRLAAILVADVVGLMAADEGLTIAALKNRRRNIVEPAYILFDGKGGGKFAFGCVTGAIHGAGHSNAIEFAWDGNDEMDEVSGDGWAE